MTRYYSGDPSLSYRRWCELLNEPPSIVACDAETISLRDRTILGVGVAFNQDEIFYLTKDDVDFMQLIKLLRRTDITKVWHNGPYDLRVLREYNPDDTNIDDTAIMSRLLGKRAVLEEACQDAGLEGVYSARHIQPEGRIDFSKLSEETVALKCIMDCWGTYILREVLWDQVPKEYYRTEIQVIPRLEVVSRKGILLDQERVTELHKYYSQQVAILYTQAQGIGFNPGSPQQVGTTLAYMGCVLPFTRTWKIRTDVKALTRQKINNPQADYINLIDMVLNYRHYSKIKSTYLDKWVGKERAYTTLHLDAITGRVSGTSAGSTEPDMNLTNIPRKVERGDIPTVRSCCISPHGVWKKADASQIELRVLAHLSGDVNMQAVFDNNGSLHRDTAKRTGLSYDISKTLNYAMIFGAEPYTISESTGYPLDQAAEFIRLWMSAYPQASKYFQQQQYDGLQNGYVETLFGRRMPIPLDAGEKHARNCTISYSVQGTAADIFKRQILANKINEPHTLLYVHDEHDFDQDVPLPESLAYVSEIYTPLDEEVSKSWG
jgi:DNA polymerase-1